MVSHLNVSPCLASSAWLRWECAAASGSILGGGGGLKQWLLLCWGLLFDREVGGSLIEVSASVMTSYSVERPKIPCNDYRSSENGKRGIQHLGVKLLVGW